MRISELSRETGIPIATIKFYLREHLLHEGRRTSTTQAQYDETHIARLRLVRALIGVGKLSVAATREVLAHLNQTPASMHDLLGDVQRLLGPPVADDVDVTEAWQVVEQLGWLTTTANEEPVHQLAAALAAIRAADFPLSDEGVLDYGRAMQELAEDELTYVPDDSPEGAVRYVALGTILIEPLLLALRRLAHQYASAQRFSDETTSEPQ